MNNTKLELNFENAEGKNKKLTILRPNLGLTEAEILPVMDVFVTSDIFDADGLDPYVTANNARYVRTEIEDIYNREEA